MQKPLQHASAFMAPTASQGFQQQQQEGVLMQVWPNDVYDLYRLGCKMGGRAAAPSPPASSPPPRRLAVQGS